MSQDSRNLEGLAAGTSTLGKPLSRRRLMGAGAGTLGAAILAGGAARSAAAGPAGAFGGGRVVTNQDGGTEYHGAYPYLDPGAGGHFNTFVTDGILPPGPAGTVYGELIMTPLAMYFWASGEWLPLLAETWGFVQGTATPTASPEASPVAVSSPIAGTSGEQDTFQVTLRQDATWSDGTPFTATDVVDTLWCARILSNTLWQYIDDAVAVDDYTVQCHMSVPSTQVERYVLRTLPPRPSSVFGDWAQQARDVFGAGLTIDDPEGAQLLEQFNLFRPEGPPPATGPYQIDAASISNAQMTLVKNDSSVFAPQALFDQIINFNGETDTISAVVLNGDVDYATHGFATATEQEFLNMGIRVLRPPVYSGPAILMNFATLGDTFTKEARQGIAHAIDGDQIGFFSLAESGVPVTYNTGFSDNIINDWLDQEAIDGLNQYATDQEGAATLLEAAGWTRDGDAWVQPNGEPAAFELTFPAEFADWSAAGQALTEQLTAFGIAIEPRAVTFTQQPIDVDQGNFQLAIRAWGSSNNPHPHFAYDTAFFVHNTLAVNNGGEGISFPLEQETDVAGTVDLTELVVNSARGLDIEAQKADVTVMAQVFNDLLPKIPLFERYGNNAALEGVRVAAWPADDDPILLNSPYADGIPTMLIYQGLLEPFQG